MGGWELWGALIVGAAIWIIGHVLRQNQQEDPRRTPPRPQPENRPPRPRAQSGTTDLDRFLQEVQRRKQMAEGRPPREAVPKKPASPPRRPPRRDVPEALPTRTPGAERRNEPAVVEVVAVEERPRATITAPPVVVAVAEAVGAGDVQPGRRAFPLHRKQQDVPAVAAVQSLMRSPDALRAAFVLQEVLGPPLARRHGRRGFPN